MDVLLGELMKPFTEMPVSRLLALGFEYFDKEFNDLLLIPLDLVGKIPYGTKVISLSGEIFYVTPEFIENAIGGITYDELSGYVIPYGIYPKMKAWKTPRKVPLRNYLL